MWEFHMPTSTMSELKSMTIRLQPVESGSKKPELQRKAVKTFDV